MSQLHFILACLPSSQPLAVLYLLKVALYEPACHLYHRVEVSKSISGLNRAQQRAFHYKTQFNITEKSRTQFQSRCWISTLLLLLHQIKLVALLSIPVAVLLCLLTVGVKSCEF